MSPLASLATRVDRDEEMDAATLAPDRYARVLRDLARVNVVTRAAAPTLAFIASFGDAPLRILDVGFGQGDMLRRIGTAARRRGQQVELVGVDLNPNSVAAARAATPAAMPIAYASGDYADLPGPWDIVISSLVAHHMSDRERRDFLRFMDGNTRRGWFVNDLHRARIAFAGYPLLAALLGVDPIVRRDGQLSVARSFRASDWRAALADAGVTGATITRHFPYRLCVAKRH